MQTNARTQQPLIKFDILINIYLAAYDQANLADAAAGDQIASQFITDIDAEAVLRG